VPLIEVTLAEGRSPDQVRSMIHEVHEALLRTVDTKPEHIRVIVREVPRSHWATGDITLSEMDSRNTASTRAPAGTTPREEEQS
jgi:4-oxalocrotonate tautomerase